ncbi:adenylate/guanylate cyclase (plasmid) [Rhizobium favelukesii]|uniref:Adenylate/guanylate cyclase n=1 Tax=Rhizobium favelukesii TaxID=348824 RepID=W6RJY4_9HYPH|nr:adenylate/guanylate cyclase [Rhizobium favelukesii]
MAGLRRPSNVFLCEASDFRVNRINPLAFAMEVGLDETACIGAFLHATQIGIVDLAWNVVCGGCGSILHSANSLKAINDLHYRCGLCAADCQTMLDDSVEVTFTVSPKLRAISAHEPDTLPLWDYVRQVYWSSGSDLPADLRPVVDGAALDAIELSAGSFATRTLRMAEGFVVVFDPVTHSSTLLRVVGTLQDAQQMLTIALAEGVEERAQIEVAPGLFELTLENRTRQRAMRSCGLRATHCANSSADGCRL